MNNIDKKMRQSMDITEEPLHIDELHEKKIMELAYPSDRPEKGIIKNFRTADHETPIVSVPIELLRFRVENGRIARDVMSKKIEEDGFFKDNTDSASKFIAKSLWAKDKKACEVLYKSILGDEQNEPAIITADGQVIDGNRRLAIVKRLYEEKQDKKYGSMKCLILPGNKKYSNPIKRNDITSPPTKTEITKLEIYFQLSQEAKSEYSDFDKALTRRNYKNQDKISFEAQVKMDTSFANATTKEIEKAVKKFEKDERCLEIVDQYLAWVGQEKLYDVIEDGNKNVVSWKSITYYYDKIWSKIEDEEGCHTEDIDPDKRSEIQKSSFNMMREGDLGLKTSLYKKMDYFLNFWKNDQCIKIMENTACKIKGKLQDEDIEGMTTYKEIDRKWKEINQAQIRSGFKAAQVIVDNKKEQEDPLGYMKAALEKLNKVRVENIPNTKASEALQYGNNIAKITKLLTTFFYDLDKGKNLEALLEKFNSGKKDDDSEE